MSGQSSVGNRAVYEAGDQRNPPVSELQDRARYAEGQTHSHQNLDSKDGRSIANKLASQSNKPNPSHHHNYEADQEAELSKQDPTKPVSFNGYIHMAEASHTNLLYRLSCTATLPPRVLRSTPSSRLKMSSAFARRASSTKFFDAVTML